MSICETHTTLTTICESVKVFHSSIATPTYTTTKYKTLVLNKSSTGFTQWDAAQTQEQPLNISNVSFLLYLYGNIHKSCAGSTTSRLQLDVCYIYTSSRIKNYLEKRLQPRHFSNQTALNLEHTANQERNEQYGNQHHNCKLLMMGIVVPETCWAHKKHNKIISGIKLIFYSSVITMMHGPMDIRFSSKYAPTGVSQYSCVTRTAVVRFSIATGSELFPLFPLPCQIHVCRDFITFFLLATYVRNNPSILGPL